MTNGFDEAMTERCVLKQPLKNWSRRGMVRDRLEITRNEFVMLLGFAGVGITVGITSKFHGTKKKGLSPLRS